MRNELAIVDSVTDLGVRFESKLAFLDHMNKKVNITYSILGIIKRNFYIFGYKLLCFTATKIAFRVCKLNKKMDNS